MPKDYKFFSKEEVEKSSWAGFHDLPAVGGGFPPQIYSASHLSQLCYSFYGDSLVLLCMKKCVSWCTWGQKLHWQHQEAPLPLVPALPATPCELLACPEKAVISSPLTVPSRNPFLVWFWASRWLPNFSTWMRSRKATNLLFGTFPCMFQSAQLSSSACLSKNWKPFVIFLSLKVFIASLWKDMERVCYR